MIDFKRCPDGMPCGGSCSPFECRRDTRPATPKSETPETDALVARWADMAKQPADLTFTQLHDLIEQAVKEILKSHEDLERRLAQAQTRIADLEKDAARYRWLKANHLQTGADSWIRTGNDLEEAIDSALKSRP